MHVIFRCSHGGNTDFIQIDAIVSTQGSAKLEKAEILQMTVDHLKMLHASGGKGNRLFLTLSNKYIHLQRAH